MNTTGIVIISRPANPATRPYLIIADHDKLVTYELYRDAPLSITVDKSTKYCTGWYDISTHTNYPCERLKSIGDSHISCFSCRKKTDFNPAFYNASQVSETQTTYNNMPHTVYIAYFGSGSAKAGIMSDSRGKERLYEQGALLYAIVSTCPNATAAHKLEAALIGQGLKNSMTKKQKAAAYQNIIDLKQETDSFRSILYGLGHKGEIVSNLDMFFFGKYINEQIEAFENTQISGNVIGVIGRYLVLKNNDRYYGFWLSDIFGYKTTFDTQITLLDRKPQQARLF
ncbi:MAG: DUF2797 domain-containing protein [Candidatus Saccharimonadales bacterium]